MVELSKYIILLPCVTALIIGFFVKNLVDFIPNKFILLLAEKIKRQEYKIYFEINEESELAIDEIKSFMK